MKRVHVIINPASGRPQPVLSTLNTVFREAGVEWDVPIPHRGGAGRRAAAAVSARGVDVVAVYGGDGTILEAAAGLVGTTTPLAILPGGTANVLSVELGIPRGLAAAARLACSTDSPIRRIDMARSGDRFSIQRIGIGLDAAKLSQATRELKQRIGRLAYSVSWLQAAGRAPMARYRLRLDGQEVECEGVTCHIANSGSIGLPGLTLLPGMSVSDGLLDVLVIRDASIGSTLSIARIAAGQTGDPGAFSHWQVREVSVMADPPQPVHGDGDLWEDTPLDVRVVPGAVGILTPKGRRSD